MAASWSFSLLAIGDLSDPCSRRGQHIAAPGLAGQSVSFGFVGGTSLTRDFPVYRSMYTDPAYPGGLTAADLYAGSRPFIAGVAVELRLPDRFALEINALHRNLNLRTRLVFPDGQRRERGQRSISTWQWPVLLKYRFPFEPAQPFVETGPSFRTRKDPAPTEPSQFGATIGAGLQFNWRRVRVSPTLRYTRWAYDGPYPRIATKRDQIEFLTAVTYASSLASWRIGGKKIRIGGIAGIPLTGGLEPGPSIMPFLSEEQGYAAGLALEVELTSRVSLEMDGLYRPLRAHSLFFSPRVPPSQTEFTVLTWQIPLLAKLSLRPAAKFSPILEAGPSFRLSGNRNGREPSPAGFTAGAGIETRFRNMKLGPVLRYTRWSADRRPGPRTVPNQVEVLVGFTF